jgi:hypothetical protein
MSSSEPPKVEVKDIVAALPLPFPSHIPKLITDYAGDIMLLETFGDSTLNLVVM